MDGQDGSYLAEQLIAAGMQLTGIVHPRRELPVYVENLREHGACELLAVDLADPAAFRHALRSYQPERVFHLGAVSHPLACEEDPETSRSVNVTSVEVLLDWLRRDRPEARVLTVASSAVFGKPDGGVLDEQSPADPQSEYARQKQAVRELAAAARDQGLFVACAIPFNHESPRRTEDFVFTKICRSAVRIAARRQDQLALGNMSVKRDWGYAPEYVTAMAWMLDIDTPTELVLATGEAHSVLELAKLALSSLGLEPNEHIVSDPALARSGDVAEMVGDASRAWNELGWEATTKFTELVRMMVDAARDGAD